MCIIAVKPAELELDLNILENCWNNNPHGAGYMLLHKGSVHIIKGFMELESFLEYTERRLQYLQDHTVVFHFRIATSGLTNPANCHPFPVTANARDRARTHIATTAAIVHNGIVPKLGTAVYSDTFQLAKLLADMKPKKRVRYLSRLGTYNKFVLMTQNKTTLCGEFEEHAGWHFSNDGYMSFDPQPYENNYPYDACSASYGVCVNCGEPGPSLCDGCWDMQMRDRTRVNAHDRAWYQDDYDLDVNAFVG
jgi:hypothetical protein